MNITLNERALTLLPEKALYLQDERLLLVADVHLGKAMHFRKAGIAIPGQAQVADYIRLQALFEKVKPESVYFLGDLFHSTLNADWQSFCTLIEGFPDIRFVLLKGNHDLIDAERFHCLNVIVEDRREDEQFLYSHHPLKAVPQGKINICGHIHPGVLLSGSGRQSVKLPCFYLEDQTLILPAFGTLTGLYIMERRKNAQIFCILPNQVRRAY